MNPKLTILSSKTWCKKILCQPYPSCTKSPFQVNWDIFVFWMTQGVPWRVFLGMLCFVPRFTLLPSETLLLGDSISKYCLLRRWLGGRQPQQTCAPPWNPTMNGVPKHMLPETKLLIAAHGIRKLPSGCFLGFSSVLHDLSGYHVMLNVRS